MKASQKATRKKLSLEQVVYIKKYLKKPQKSNPRHSESRSQHQMEENDYAGVRNIGKAFRVTEKGTYNW